MKKSMIYSGLVLAGALLVVLPVFVYNNVIVPWPYRHELRACLIAADNQVTEIEVSAARNVCFRTYPHFN